MNLVIRASALKEELGFPDQAMDIPNEYLILALTPKEGEHLLPKNVIDITQNTNHETIEFLGDAVLELAVSDYIYFNRQYIPEATSGVFSQVRVSAVENLNLTRVMGKLCKLIISPRVPIDMDSKVCADIFEAIVGAVYIHLRTRGDCNPVEVIQRWLVYTLDIFPQGIGAPKQTLLPRVQRLQQLYTQKNIRGIPQYKIQKTRDGYVAHVKCPTELACSAEQEFIGTGVGETENVAKRRAAEEAINVLQQFVGRKKTIQRRRPRPPIQRRPRPE